MRTVALVLAGRNADSKVIIDDLDVSSMCTGVEVEAFIGQPTKIVLHLIADCRLLADVPEVTVDRHRARPEDEQ